MRIFQKNTTKILVGLSRLFSREISEPKKSEDSVRKKTLRPVQLHFSSNTNNKYSTLFPAAETYQTFL